MDLKLVLHKTIIKSGKRSMEKNQSFKARQVDVTANSQRLSNPLYIGMKTWRINRTLQQAKGQYSVQNVVNININNLENSFKCSYLRILKCLEKQSLFCLELYCEYL